MANSVKIDRYLVTATGKASTWMTIGAAVAIALVYFLAARLGLSLLAQPADVAVFWPASGVATGILARISHTKKCIGAPNQRKFFCDKEFPQIRGRPDADRL